MVDAPQSSSSGTAELVARARSRLAAMRISPCSGITSSRQAAEEFEQALDALTSSPTPQIAGGEDQYKASVPDDLRFMGWSVAVHNDYRVGGVPHTFWLFTKQDRAIKGEGETDEEALNIVRSQIHGAALSPQAQAGETPLSFSGADPADLWDEWLSETDAQYRTPQSAMAFAAAFYETKLAEIDQSRHAAQRPADSGEPAAWFGWNSKSGYAWETKSDSEQDAAASLMRSGRTSGNHGWEVRALYAAPPAPLHAGLSEEERHAVEHARYQADRATPDKPECGFDFDLVKDLVRAIDRAYPLPSTEGK